jgi:hypothetical protein
MESDFETLVAILGAVIVYNRARKRRKLLKRALVPIRLSAWNRLLSYADESSFLEVTGFSFSSFRSLVQLLNRNDSRQRSVRAGRPWALDYNGRSGVLLFYLGSQMRTKHLCLLFGVTPTVIERVLEDSMRMVINILTYNPTGRLLSSHIFLMKNFLISVPNRGVLSPVKIEYLSTILVQPRVPTREGPLSLSQELPSC